MYFCFVAYSCEAVRIHIAVLLVFLFRRLTLFFVLHLFTANVKKSELVFLNDFLNFLNCFFLSVTARVTSFLILSLAKVLSSFA